MKKSSFPKILPMRQRANLINKILEQRLQKSLPKLMRETGIDMWLIICQEDNPDPVLKTLMPMDTWCPILQVLVFYDQGQEKGLERINISGTNTHDLYDRPYKGQVETKQWDLLKQIIEKRVPEKIGINTGEIEWAAGGLTHNLYLQLSQKLPQKYTERFYSAESLVTRWLSTFIEEEIAIYEHVVNIAHNLLAECYSRKAVIPGITTIEDLEWYYWQRCNDLGLNLAFKPYFTIVRSHKMREKFGEEDQVIRQGDLIHSDVGINYLRYNTDHQQWAYVLPEGEQDTPEGMREIMKKGNQLQDIFMNEFVEGLTGNELLKNILTLAKYEGLPEPKVYSHSLGYFLHEPGPLIGLPWEQKKCPGRGDVKLNYNNAFAMELSVTDSAAEWENQKISMSMEEDIVFTENGCRPLDGRQTKFYLI